ncbi:uridine phosphorylase [Bellilinea caldifistulae]|uniref:nucleoside phosphorylase n=1 Tax=Bellilinea caldifistulae TaxID=360411 RepID=UPI0007814DA2|nr:nucleoside phosphorylase [Bellilinea caldifistulae]GAP09295.1 uridine phosphorylase [Bellilinea caldifistulae]
MNPNQTVPLLEFDPAERAILEPRPVKLTQPAPPRAVLCFFQDVINRLRRKGRLKVIGRLKSEIGPNPLYILEENGQNLLVAHPGVGAPLSAGFLEEIIALGVNRFIAAGGCGVIDHSINAGHPLILTGAVRDEGVSYHYLPPGREVSASPAAVAALQAALKSAGMPYTLAKAWTTDGIYRETVNRRATRLAEGCQVVEMEAAAFFAVAQFRGVTFGELVYGGDLVVPEGWDSRAWHKRADDRERIFWLAVQACLHL